MGDIMTTDALRVGYGNITAVDGVSIGVPESSMTAILGANGAGKSTLLNAVMGVTRPRSGRIFFKGADITGSRPDRVARLGVALVPEGRRIFAELSVHDNLRFGALTCPAGEQEAQLELCLRLFPDLAGRMKQLGGTLSGGQQQMLAISRALMSKPQLLILDEPSLGVAPKLTQEIYVALDYLRTEGTSILLVEQYANLALTYSDQAYVLVRGKVKIEGSSESVRNDAEVRKAYLGIDG